MTRPGSSHGFRDRRSQRGAVLYVALIMLILLALLGIIGMQVASMQERMAASYRAVNRAFQNAEGVVREAECSIEGIVNRTGSGDCTIVGAGDISQVCDVNFDANAWAATQSSAAVPTVNVRQIDTCVQGQAPLEMGTQPVNESTFPIYQITTYAADDDENPSSSSVVDTIFKL